MGAHWDSYLLERRTATSSQPSCSLQKQPPRGCLADKADLLLVFDGSVDRHQRMVRHAVLGVGSYVGDEIVRDGVSNR